MADNTIQVSPANQRAAAAHHKAVAEALGSVTANHEEILAWANNLGPVFEEWASELHSVLADRHNFYTDEADEHHNLATGLEKTALMFEANEQRAATAISGVIDTEARGISDG